jgi:2-polyprenyl-3-methyl-5-hydroxy-6-metoxy-1,4-benzoquinol methylase
VSVAITDDGHRRVAVCETRTACAACGASDLVPELELPNVPVHMGCTDRPAQTDAFADQHWATCTRCGTVQLAALAPLDLVYQTQHNGAVGGVWARHHAALAAFVAERAPHRVVEVGGASGALAREYAATHDFASWTVVEPNPTFTPQPPIHLVTAYVEEVADVVAGADAIVHSHLLEHLYRPRAFLRTIREQARPDATMLLSVPNLPSLLEQSGANAINFEHTYFFDLPLLEWMLRDAGFTVEDTRAFERHSFFLAARPDAEPGTAGPPPDARGGARAFVRFVAAARADARALAARAAAFDGPVYLFGAHVFSQFLIGCGFPPERAVVVLDNDPAKQGLRLYGTPLTVQPPAVLDGVGAAVIVRATHYTAEITDQLRALAPGVEIW